MQKQKTSYTNIARSCLVKYRMQSQIVIIQTAIFLSIVILIQGVYLINGLISQALIFEASQQLLFNETSKHQQIISQKLQRQVNQHFSNRYTLLDHITQLNQFIDKTPINIPQQQPCSYSVSQMSGVLPQLDIFCYFYSNNTIKPFEVVDEIEDHNFLGVISVLNEHLIQFHKQHTKEILFLTLIRDDQLAAIIPQQPYQPYFKTHSRPWYIQHMKHLQEQPESTQFISSIYQHYSTKAFELTQSRSLTNSNDTLVGVIGFNNNFQAINFSFPGLCVMLLDPQGRILNSNTVFPYPIDFTMTNVSIFNESLTGFTYDDWVQMQLQMLNMSGQSNCEIKTSSLCRYNEQFQNPVIMNMFDYMNSFQLLVVSNLTQTLEHQQYSEQLYLNLYQTFNNYFYIFICISVILFMISFLCLRIIFVPMLRIQRYVQLCVSQRFTLSLQIINYKQGSNNVFDILTNMVIAFWPKMQRGNEKSVHCKIIEQFKYPSNSQQKLPCDLKEFKDQFLNENIKYLELTICKNND